MLILCRRMLLLKMITNLSLKIRPASIDSDEKESTKNHGHANAPLQRRRLLALLSAIRLSPQLQEAYAKREGRAHSSQTVQNKGNGNALFLHRSRLRSRVSACRPARRYRRAPP